MALSILDGTQTATTLSTILSSGQHITAHTVVSLGTQAITDIVNATSAGLTNTQLRASAVTIGGTVTVGGFSSVSIGSGALLAGGLRGGGVEPLGLDVATGYLLVKVDSALPAGTNRIGVVTIGAGTVTIGAGTAQIGSVTASISNSVTIASLPEISGTVTVGGFSGNAVTTGYTFNGNAVSSVPVIVMENSNGSIGTVDVSGGFISVTTGTNRIGVVTIGGGTVTIGAGTSQIGSVTASISNSLTISSLPAISGTVTANAGGDFANSIENVNDVGNVSKKIAVQLYDDNGGAVGVPNNPFPISGTVTVGSLPSWGVYDSGNDSLKISINDVGGSAIGTSVPISGTVTANTFAVQGTAVTTSNFTSTTPSTVLAGFNATREVLTIFNEGAGNLHICAGATCTTIAYQVRLSAGDYYEVPNHQTTITHSAVFATAGTARVTQVS